ncbi:MAG: TaqI-like C-terminal specificity domain-containing protein [Methanothrix sp.]|nr:TaqI-like C-terminal specificity domain-containing protein [Methanothrix sp.]HPY73273.1 TaqI-like C-terminal specificity domain-containing protein [Methanothrix sp.]
MAAPREIVELVERFERNVDAYKSGRYNETQLRREFIDPFFGALGWDVENRGGRLGLQREVIHEDSVLVRDSMKNPDYGFYIGTARKFFVEAKKPSVNLENDVRAAFQLRSYAWSAGLPISLLTDFEEFSIYDCRIEPSNYDSPRVGLLRHFTYDKYVDHWDEIAALFSREAVLGGSLERYIESKKKARGTITVDEAFLREIDSWREILAKNIHRNNPDLTVRELNSSVQNTIDRIVFLRICEDRGIERFGQLKDRLTGETTIYTRLIELFRQADEKYNSGLFHFKEESGRGEPDRLTPSLKIDDVVLSEMIEKLYPPESPYRFSVIPAEILGHVYEQFLGKVISLGEDGGVEVEYKPEVRKAGGVYYTPTYIVEYIVEKTVGKLLAGQTPTTVSELRILDPACGSGSFLIGAYQRLLDWHLEWYTSHLVPHLAAGKAESSREVQALLPPGGPAGAGAVGNAAGAAKRRGRGRPRKSSAAASPCAANGQRAGSFPIFQAAGGEWRLATAERKRILLNNICGVDIDLQAVEVTKLSLQLKVLEGENQETLSQQLTLFKERALPDLGENIKCGNSLIDPDFYDGQTSLFDEEEMYRVNAFDWEAEFPEIMGRGGFDAVIGNPPYITISGKQNSHVSFDVKNYAIARYKSAEYKVNYFSLFIEKGIKLLSDGSRLGFIVPRAFMDNNYFKKLRKIILDSCYLDTLVEIRDSVFNGAETGGNVILVLIKSNCDETYSSNITNGAVVDDVHFFSTDSQAYVKMEQKHFREQPNFNFFIMNKEHFDLIVKIKTSNTTLSDICSVYNGANTGNMAKILLSKEKVDYRYIKILEGKNISRYTICWNGLYICYDPSLRDKIDIKSLDTRQKKIDFALRDPAIFHTDKIILRQTADRLIGTFDDEHYITRHSTHLILMKKDISQINLKYILGLFNSRLLTYYYQKIIPEVGKTFAEVKTVNVGRLPIRTIDFSGPEDVARHDKMVKLVENMLDLHRRLSESKTGHEKTLLSRQIETTDRQIDALVYELYGLSEEEIAIVEEAAR